MIDWFSPAATADALPAYRGPAPTMGDAFDAGRLNYDAGSNSIARDVYAAQIGAEITRALAARGRTGMVAANGKRITYKPESLRRDYIAQPTVQPRLLQDIAAERRRDPEFLKDLFPEGVSEAALEAAIIARRKRDFESSSAVLENAEGLGTAAGFVGGLAATFEDPLQLVGMGATAALPITAIAGRGAATATRVAPRLFGGSAARVRATAIAARLGTAGTINAGVVAATLPVMDDRLAEIGVEMGGADIAKMLAMGFAAGGIIEGGQMAVAAGARAAAPAVTGSVRRMAAALRNTGKERPLTPDEADALAVLDEAAEDIRSSPYVPTAEGDAVHAARLEEAVSALENDRPIDPAPFTETTAPLRSEVETAQYLDMARAYAADRGAGPLTPEAFGAAAGLAPDDARQILMTLAAKDRSVRMSVRTDKATGAQAQVFRRAPQRSGPVDLLTWIGDRGGISTANAHSLLQTLGQKFIPGSGPLFRKTGFDLESLGQALIEDGWVPERLAYDPNAAGGMTEAEVLALLDRAVRGDKIYRPDDLATVAERDAAAGNASGAQAAFMEAARADMQRYWLEELPEFVTEGQPMTPEQLAEIEPFMTPERDAKAAYDAWMESWTERNRAEIDAAYEAIDNAADVELPPEYRMEGSDGGDGGNPAIARAAGDGAENGDGPGAVSRNAGQRGDADTPSASPIADADAAGGAAEAALEGFDDPTGPAIAAQVESLVHDLRAEVTGDPVAGPGEPPVPTGMIRVYHGGNDATTGGGGRWVTTSRPKAQGYADKSGGQLWFTDLPENHPRLTPEYPEQGYRQGFTFEWELTEAETLRLQTMDEARPNPLDLGEQVDPAAAARAAQELALQANSPMRGRAEQADLSDTGLFGQIDAFAMHDGKAQTKADLLAEIEADDAALNTLRGCL
ncbi:MAG: hypothetical protein MUE77_11965 [Sandarakinorhabdus sp.]|nr:hypothetical protein [Sandarakinorhabdus sp.]